MIKKCNCGWMAVGDIQDIIECPLCKSKLKEV